ncbi:MULTISPECIES: GH25 family lysozyme [unclassified Levilactobacillus]|uniref:GH25 family lysozyme n=1 Tax=unclassified Levilactobacillus TaxID=2767918 RepID=UPI002FF30151
MSKIIVDLSSYQASSLAYMKQLRSWGAKGIVVKLTEGTSYLSPKAAAQVKNGLKVFKTVGAYHFFHGNGLAEAQYFLAWVKKMGLDKTTVLAIDVEAAGLPSNTTPQVNVFLRYLIDHGYKHVITYGSASWFNSGRIHRSQLVSKAIWVAAYNGYGPGVTNADAWQHTDRWHYVDASYDYSGALSGTKAVAKAKPKKASYLKSVKQVRALTSVSRYRGKVFDKKHRVDTFPVGQYFDIKKVVKYGKVTRLKLANGMYITSNTKYVKKTK